jgi:hypothetical protein
VGLLCRFLVGNLTEKFQSVDFEGLRQRGEVFRVWHALASEKATQGGNRHARVIREARFVPPPVEVVAGGKGGAVHESGEPLEARCGG